MLLDMEIQPFFKEMVPKDFLILESASPDSWVVTRTFERGRSNHAATGDTKASRGSTMVARYLKFISALTKTEPRDE